MKFLHRTFTAALAFTLLTVSSCGSDRAQSESKVSKSFDSTEASYQPNLKRGKEQVHENRKLIWTADLEFQVKSVDKSTEEINALSAKYGGFVSDMNLSNNTYRISNTITVRIPNSKFQLFVSAIKGESIFMDRADISSEDVTEEFVDIEARLKAKRAVRDRYIEVLKTKTGSVKDIIEAEEAIRVITEEIEAKEGRLRFLNNRVDLSTVTINMYEKVKYVDSPERFEKNYSDEVGESFGTGWQAVKVILLGFISIWPLLFAGLIALGIWKRKKITGLFKRK
ncbi:MAG: DUF4349 domain-containing protein [Crocinitomicaceae bacterium]|nr:DUF4349 domain-containing protein [Flavobacteriales bacterium]NQZ35825.1 DUF4349 domain-containing protein [Crocinitomicaceae bacterium]